MTDTDTPWYKLKCRVAHVRGGYSFFLLCIFHLRSPWMYRMSSSSNARWLSLTSSMALLARAKKALVSYVYSHPILTLEHVGFVLILLLWRVDSAWPNDERWLKAGQTPAAARRAALESGPLNAFTSFGIVEAPIPSMANGRLEGFGEMIHYNDSRGDITRYSLGSGRIVNLMRTVKGTMRSGDLHNCTQYDVILKGRTKLWLKDLRTQLEVVRDYGGDSDFLLIPPRVPHIFEFLEDNVMIEWWDCEYHAWHYMPYRKLIQEFLTTKRGL